MEIRIRDARAHDAPAAARLLTQLGYPAEAAQVAGRLARLGRDPGSRVLLAEVDGVVGGVAALHVMPLLEHDELACQIIALVVDEARRGQGIGSALVRAAQAEARRRGCFGLVVTSGNWRDAAHAFYRGQGFEETGRRFVKRLV